MAVVLYRSSDTSAPSLDGTAGSLVAVLDGILVNGYGSKSAAGWTKSFSGTNKGDYRMGGANQFYLDVDDSAAQTAVGKEANVRGYEAMTALQTGTNPFPTTGQISSPGLVLRKSATADATARTWVAVADNKTLILAVQQGDLANRWDITYFGDFYSLISADPGRAGIIARSSANNSNASAMVVDLEDLGNDQNGHFMARRTTGAAGALQFGKESLGAAGAPSQFSSEAGPSLDGNYYTWAYNLGSNTDHRLRGKLRGLWRLTPGATEGDTFTGTGDLAGRSFLVLGAVGQSSTSMALETSDTWDTSS